MSFSVFSSLYNVVQKGRKEEGVSDGMGICICLGRWTCYVPRTATDNQCVFQERKLFEYWNDSTRGFRDEHACAGFILQQGLGQ